MQSRTTLLSFVLGMSLCAAPALAQRAQDAPSPKERDDKDAPKVAKVGEPAPAFTLLDSEGKKHSLADYKEKVVVLEWVNLECPWSRAAVPQVKELRKKYKDKDIVWLGIDSTNWRKPEENTKYIREEELGFPILMDNDGEVGHLYGARTTPHVYVIDKGKLVYSGALHNDQQGRTPKDEVRHYVDEAIAACLDGKPIPVGETKPWGCSVKYAEKRGDARPGGRGRRS